MLNGLLVTLRAMREEDAELMRSWRNDPEVYQGLVERTPISTSAQARWFSRIAEAEAQGLALWFVVVALDGTSIGWVSLTDLDRRSRHAQWAMSIGEAAYRRGGYAADAAIRTLDFAFGHLNLRRVWCRVLESNEPALALNRRLGFVEEGRLRGHVFEEGGYQDMVIMGLQQEEFARTRPALLAQLEDIAATYRRRLAEPAGG